MLEQYKRAEIIYDIPNDDLCNLYRIELIPLYEFLQELGLDYEDFSKTDGVLKTSRTLCNLNTMELALRDIRFLRNEWQKKLIFFLGTKLYFPQKVPKEYPPEDIYPYLRYAPSKALYFETRFHYKLFDRHWLNHPSKASTPWHVAVY